MTVKVMPREITGVEGEMPLVGSRLRSHKREVMAAAIVRICQQDNRWGRVCPPELFPVLETIAAYKLFPQLCWNEFHQMVEEGLLVNGKDEKGACVEFLNSAHFMEKPDLLPLNPIFKLGK